MADLADAAQAVLARADYLLAHAPNRVPIEQGVVLDLVSDLASALRAALAAAPPTPEHEPGPPEWSVHRGYGVLHKDGGRLWCYTASQVQSPHLAKLVAGMLNNQIPPEHPAATAPPDDEPAEAEQLRRLVKLHAGAHQLCAEAFIHMGEAVITKIADGGTLAEVLDLVGDCMNERDAVDEACEALFDRARAAAGSPPPTPDDHDCMRGGCNIAGPDGSCTNCGYKAGPDHRDSPEQIAEIQRGLAALVLAEALMGFSNREGTEPVTIYDEGHARDMGRFLISEIERAGLWAVAASAGPPPTNGPTRQQVSQTINEMTHLPLTQLQAVTDAVWALLESHRPDNDPLVPGLENVRASAEPVCGDQYHRHVGSCYLYQAPDNDPAGPTVPEVTGDGTGHALPPFDPRATRARTDQVDVTPGKDHPTGDDDG